MPEFFSLFELFDICVDSKHKPIQANWQSAATYTVNGHSYTFNEFIRVIIKPFYFYLVDYIYINIRNSIKTFFKSQTQVIIIAKKNPSILDRIELKLHKSLLRNFWPWMVYTYIQDRKQILGITGELISS